MGKSIPPILRIADKVSIITTRRLIQALIERSLVSPLLVLRANPSGIGKGVVFLKTDLAHTPCH
jgi:hypothetical protein